MQFINESGLEFSDISSEAWRRYEFPGDVLVTIHGPLLLNVSKTGGHRIWDQAGISHYVPAGWVHLTWVSRPGSPNFVK